MQSTDIPVWLGILLCIVGLGITVVMAKWVAHREKKRSAIATNSKA